jgi:DNA-binding transcriptional MerR regulator
MFVQGLYRVLPLLVKGVSRYFWTKVVCSGVMADHLLRIGELSRRTGVSPEVLRAWERRYGLFAPQRTDGGFRLYSASDVLRITEMKRLLADGVSANEAAQRITASPPGNTEPAPGPSLFEGRRDALLDALRSYDEGSAHTVIDQLLMKYSIETVMQLAFLPVLAEIGELWERGQLTVAAEHFASNLLRRRLGALTRGWEDGVGPKALLACPPDEEHDLPLLMFGIALGNRGWRITYLGARTPGAELTRTAKELRPAILVLASPDPEAFRSITDVVRDLGDVCPVAIGGAGANAEFAEATGALLLHGDPVAASTEVATMSWKGSS